MSKLLHADLTDEKLRRSLGGGLFTFPALNSKSDLYFGLRFTRSRSVGGRILHVVDHPIVREIRCTIGQTDVRPEAGQFTLKVGGGAAVLGTNLTTALNWNATAAEIAAALNALSVVGTASVVEDDDSYLVTGVADAITVVSNTLRPLTFVRIESYQVDGATTQAIRLQRAPLAFADTYTQRVPSPPTIARVQAGGSDGDITWNEVQKLTVPLDFQGSYQIRSADSVQRTPLLGLADTAATISAAINPSADGASLGVAADSEGVFVVTQHPTEPAVLIEFAGSMAGAGHDLLTVSVFDAPEGDYWLTVPLDTTAMAEAFREADKLTKVPLEIFVDVEDPDDDEIVRTLPVYRGEVTIHEGVTHADLGTAANIDYLRPPAPKSYPPFNPTQVLTGQRHYSTAAGNGSATTFAIAHNLASEELDVRVRENASGGRLLVHGTDYEVEFTDANSLDVTMLGSYASPAPGTGALIITVADLTAAATFAEDIEIEMGQVNGLLAAFDALGDRVTVLEAGFGVQPGLVATGSASETLRYPLRPVWRVLPLRGAVEPAGSIAAFDPAALGLRYGRLLPAVHDAATEELPDPLPAPSEAYAGKVYEADTARDDVGEGLRAGDFAACDGDVWYQVVRYDEAESSYYPAAFEVPLFVEALTGDELTLRSTLSIPFGFEAAVLAADRRRRDRATEVTYTLLVEAGAKTADDEPGTPGENWDDNDWTVTLLEKAIQITETPRPFRFGIEITRALVDNVDTLSARKTISRATSATEAPESLPFLIRARLIRFDTRDSVPEPRGLVVIRGLSVGLDGADSPLLGLVTVG